MEQEALGDLLEGRHKQRVVHKRMLITKWVEMEMQREHCGLDGGALDTEKNCRSQRLLCYNASLNLVAAWSRLLEDILGESSAGSDQRPRPGKVAVLTWGKSPGRTLAFHHPAQHPHL